VLVGSLSLCILCCVPARLHMRVHKRVYVLVFACVFVRVHACAYVSVRVCVCTCVCTMHTHFFPAFYFRRLPHLCVEGARTHTHTQTHTVYLAQTSRRTKMGWLRLVGSLKLQVSFAKEPCKRDYILQKRLIILRSLLSVATPW